MGDILTGAVSVFLGIIMTLVFLWIIGIILYYIYQDRFFDKNAQKKYREDIENYKVKEKEKE